MRKRKGRGMPLEVEERFRELERGGYSAAQIYEQLVTDFGDRVGVTDRTIRSYVKARRPPDPSGTWTLADDSEEPAFLLAVLRAMLVRSEGRLFALTRKEAEWIERIKHAVPDIPPWVALYFAHDYLLCEIEGQDTAHVDMALALSAQESADPELVKAYIARHIELHCRLWPERDLWVWARESWVADEYEEVVEKSQGELPVHREREGGGELLEFWL